MSSVSTSVEPGVEVTSPGGSELERARRGRRIPAFDEQRATRRQLQWFVGGVLAAAAVVVLSVLGFNIVVDPFGVWGTHLYPTAIESDRSVKISLLERLPYNPDVLIMGSSRSRPAQPRFLQQLTGRTGFNAGVTSGNAVDWWVFSHLFFARYPKGPHHVLLFVSDGVGSNVVNPQMAADPRAQPYLPANASKSEWSIWHKLSASLSLDAARDSYRVVRACHTPGGCHVHFFHNDGSLVLSLLRRPAVRTKRMYKILAGDLQRLRQHGIDRRLPSLRDQRYFEKLLGYLNARGVTPVIVTNPLQPQLLAELNRQGNPRHTWSLNFIRSLHARYRFVFIDLTSIKTFGGSPSDFSDPTHVDTRNMRLMLRYIVAHDHGVL